MRWVRLFSTLLTAAVLAFLGAACGQIDEYGRSALFDVRVVDTEQVVLVIETDLAVPEEVVVDMAETIHLVDTNAPYEGFDVRTDMDPFGEIWIALEPPLEGLKPIVHPETKADYEALRDLVRHYARLEIVRNELPELPDDGRGLP